MYSARRHRVGGSAFTPESNQQRRREDYEAGHREDEIPRPELPGWRTMRGLYMGGTLPVVACTKITNLALLKMSLTLPVYHIKFDSQETAHQYPITFPNKVTALQHDHLKREKK